MGQPGSRVRRCCHVDSEEEIEIFKARLLNLFVSDAGALELDVMRHARMLAFERKVYQDDNAKQAAVIKKKAQTTKSGGGGAKVGKRGSNPPTAGRGVRDEVEQDPPVGRAICMAKQCTAFTLTK